MTKKSKGPDCAGTFHEPDELSTRQLRELYRNMCGRLGRECRRADKMGRDELLSVVRRMLSEDIGGVVHPDEPSVTRPLSSEKAEECYAALLEALRMYVRYYQHRHSGNSDDEHAAVCLSSARALVNEACSLAIDYAGNGWEKAGRAFSVIDRAILKMRNDFCDCLVSSCVMSSLLSEEHQARMRAK